MADQLRMRLEDAEIMALFEDRKWQNIDYEELQQKLVQIAAGRMADEVMDYLHPLRVAAVQEDGTVILNQGGPRLAEGDIFSVHDFTEEVIDPETGRSLGSSETTVGRLRIVRVLPRISYAEVLRGHVAVGGVCRRVKAEAPVAPENRRSGVRDSDAGGVRLPFDDRGSSTVTRDR